MKETIHREGKVNVKVRRWNADAGTHGVWEQIGESKNLLTKAGIDVTCAQVYGTPQDTSASFVALTVDSGAPSTSDTEVSAEITTGGLTRAVGTYAHTAGQATCTITKTFTATAQFTAVQKAGLFDAVAAGNLIHENTFSSTNLLTNDQIQITWTQTIS